MMILHIDSLICCHFLFYQHIFGCQTIHLFLYDNIVGHSHFESRSALKILYTHLKYALACTSVDLLAICFRFYFSYAFVNCFVFLTVKYTASMKSSAGYGMAFFILPRMSHVSWGSQIIWWWANLGPRGHWSEFLPLLVFLVLLENHWWVHLWIAGGIFLCTEILVHTMPPDRLHSLLLGWNYSMILRLVDHLTSFHNSIEIQWEHFVVPVLLLVLYMVAVDLG